jgi:hypothetical protein
MSSGARGGQPDGVTGLSQPGAWRGDCRLPARRYVLLDPAGCDALNSMPHPLRVDEQHLRYAEEAWGSRAHAGRAWCPGLVQL